MSNYPLVSVVIPTYNRASVLSAALESVLAQTYPATEIVVVDDGSTDETRTILNRYADRVRQVTIEHSGSPAVARNVGLRHVTGTYIAFLDSDDYWLPTKLARQVAAMEADPQLALVSTNAFSQFEPAGPLGGLYLAMDERLFNRGLAGLIQDNFIITSTALVRRSVLTEIGGFSEQAGLIGCEDYDLWLRLAAWAEIKVINEPLAVYRHNTGNSLTATTPAPKYLRHRLLALERVRQATVGPNRPPIPTKTLIQSIAKFRRSLIMADWHTGHKLASLGSLVHLFWLQPGPTLRWSLQLLTNRLRRRR